MPSYSRNPDDRFMRAPLNPRATVATDGSNATLVTISITDGMGRHVPSEFGIRLSDNASGLGLTGTTASGAVTDKTAGTTGQLIATEVAKKAIRVQTNAAGTYQLSITDSAKTAFVISVVLGGLVLPVVTLSSASYG